MIKKVGFKNFRVLADVEVELEPFTILVGPNASGKSTILNGLNRIAKTKERGVQGLIANFDWLGALEFDPRPREFLLPSVESEITKHNTGNLSFRATSTEQEYPELQVTFRKMKDLKFHYELVFPPYAHLVNGDYLSGTSFRDEISKSWLPDSIYLQLNGKQIAEPSYTDSPIARLRSDGKGLASVLSDIKLGSSQRFERIRHDLREVVNTVADVRLVGATVGPENWLDYHQRGITDPSETRKGFKIIFDFVNAKGIPAESVSEGTLLALAILTVATESDNDWLILLDDLERGLHPLAVGDLVKVLKNLVKENPKLQIVATTHSPDLLNYVDAHEVRVVNLNEQGHTIVAKLTDHPEYERWKDTLKPGEFWAEVGENWVKRQVVER